MYIIHKGEVPGFTFGFIGRKTPLLNYAAHGRMMRADIKLTTFALCFRNKKIQEIRYETQKCHRFP